MRIVPYALLGAGIWALGPAGAAAQPLNSDEIAKLMTGTTVKSTTRNHNDMFITFERGGKLSGRIETTMRVMYDEGKWWIPRDKLLCWQFVNFAPGAAAVFDGCTGRRQSSALAGAIRRLGAFGMDHL